MLRIILADDEFLVRMAFTNTINWEEHGFELIGAVSNGLEAWEMIQKERPDIVITDLTMPKMGGLELIEKVKQAEIPCEFVVLSCHNEFEYVKQALKLGVFDYILKLSMDMDELMNIMERLKEKIIKERSKEVHVTTRTMDRFEKQEMANMQFRAIVVDAERNHEVEKESKSREQIPGLMEQVLSELTHKEIFISHGMPVLLLWEESQKLNVLLSELLQEAKRYLGISLNVGVGSRVKGNDRIRQSFDEAVAAYRHRFYKGEYSIVFYEDLSYQDSKAMNFQLLFPGFTQLLEDEKTDLKKLQDETAKELDTLRQKENVEPEQLRMYLHELLTRIKVKLENEDLKIDEALYAEAYQCINRLDYLEDIKQDLIYFLNTALDQMTFIEENELIKRVKGYVKKNLSEDLRVCEVSGRLGVNPDYMSHLFVVETGMRYTDYVNRTRIDQVCELLKTTNDKIYEIGERCGFENTNYLVRVFRRYVGMTPLEWRKIKKDENKMT